MDVVPPVRLALDLDLLLAEKPHVVTVGRPADRIIGGAARELNRVRTIAIDEVDLQIANERDPIARGLGRPARDP